MLSTGKKKAVVGLDIETGSAAATEVAANGSVSVSRFGTIPLAAGVFRDGEVGDAGALGDALKELFAKSKLSKNVRLGVASQRIAVRMLRMPRIDDPQELETAVRFQAQDHIPMPLDQAVMDWQVAGETTDENGARFLEVVAVAVRRETVRGMLTALRQAGLRPVGVDLSAFGMIRALARDSHEAIGLGDSSMLPPKSVRTTRSGSRIILAGRARPQRQWRPRRRHTCTAILATSPTSQSHAAAPVCSPVSR